MYPEIAMTVSTLLTTAPEIRNESNEPSKWAAIEQLYCHNRQAFEPQGGKTIVAWLRRARNKLSEETELSGSQLCELAKLAEGMGQSDLALEFARESGLGSSELWAFAGRMLQQRGDLKNALEYFSAIRQTDSSHQESIVDEAKHSADARPSYRSTSLGALALDATASGQWRKLVVLGRQSTERRKTLRTRQKSTSNRAFSWRALKKPSSRSLRIQALSTSRAPTGKRPKN